MSQLDDVYGGSSKFLKAADLQGTKPIVEIETAEIVENTYENETKKQIVLSFVGKDKVLGLNKTNARRIAQLINSDDWNDWVGYKIRLYEDQTQMSDGRIVPCIRIFPDLPEQGEPKAKAQAFSGSIDEPPF